MSLRCAALTFRSRSLGPVVVLIGALLLARSAFGAAATDLVVRATAASFTVGVTGAYNVTVSNLGPASTDDVITITDTLPDGLTFAAARGRWKCSAAGQAVTCTNPGPIAVGTSSNLLLSVHVGEAARPAVRNTIKVAYAGDTNAANNSVTKTTAVKAGRITPTPGTPTPTPTNGPPLPTSTATQTGIVTPATTDLLISKTVSGAFTVGANGVYNIAISNVGSASTNTAITVTDTLPNGLSFVTANGPGWTCSAAGQIVTCTTVQSIAPATTSSIALTVSVADTAYPSVTNTATLSYDGDTNAANNTARRPTTVKRGAASGGTATPTTGGALPTATATATKTATAGGSAAATDLSISKATSGTFTVGTNGTYLIAVTNLGPTNTNALITVTDPLPKGLTFVSAAGSGWNCSVAGQMVTCTNAGALAAGTSSTITLVVAIGSAAAPTVTNSATVSYAGDTNAANNTARKPTTVHA